MKRRAFGRDAGLTLRMFFTSAMLGLLYVTFAVVLFELLNVGLVPMVLIVVGLAFFQYYTSDKLALLASGAKVVEPDQAPELHAMVERLCAMADLPKPKVAVIPTDVPNAFATGRSPKHAAVAVTEGLWRRLEPREIEGVLAHELAHIANRDVLIMTLASFFAMLAGLLSRWAFFFGGGDRREGGPPVWLIVLVVSIVTYFLSFILIRTISRYREYAADRGAALVTGAPECLMVALQKIASQMTMIPARDLREVEALNAFFIIPTGVKSTAGDFVRVENDLSELLDVAAQTSGSRVRRRTDEFGFEWIIVEDPDFEDLVTTVHLVGSELVARGFGEQLLASIFRFEGGEHPVYFIYGYKRGAFWPFVPTGEKQERDNAEELELKAKLERELPIEQDLSRWFGLFGAPL